MQFKRAVQIERSGRRINAEMAIARLSEDEKRVESLELHNYARIGGAAGKAGTLQSLSGNDMNLYYAADGESLDRVLVSGEALVQLAGEKGQPGRQISSKLLEITLGPDGSTPTALGAREAVQLTMPAEAGSAARTIQAPSMDAAGEPGKGLTRAMFTGGVQYRERGEVERAANSSTLEVTLKPGMGGIDEARFAHAVRFE